MKVAALGPQDAGTIAELSNRLYGEPFRQPVSDLKHNLARAQSRGRNFSIGLYDDRGRLRGYLLAWIQRSLVQNASDQVLLVEDCCMDPDCTPYFIHMVECILQALDANDRYDCPIETVVNPEGLDLVAEHEGGFAELGYIPVASHQYVDPVLGCTMTWLRYVPQLQESGQEAPELEDSVSFGVARY